jgi:hypothetical protein
MNEETDRADPLRAAMDLEERLRAALEPSPGTVERVVRRALDPLTRPRRRRLAAAAAGAALLALLLAALEVRRLPSRPKPAPRSAIEIRGDAAIVTARSRAGRLWVVHGGSRRTSAGSIILIHKGDDR